MIDLSSPYILNYFPEDSVSLNTTAVVFEAKYKILIRLKGEDFLRSCNLTPNLPEKLLHSFMYELISYPITYYVKHTRVLTNFSLTRNPYISKMYRTSIKDLKERLIMQQTLQQPLIEIFEEVKLGA